MKATPLLLPLLLLLPAGPACQSAPVSSQALVPEQQLQLLDEIEDACMSFLSAEARPQDIDTLGQLCYMAMRAVQHSQDFTGRGDAKRVSCCLRLHSQCQCGNEMQMQCGTESSYYSSDHCVPLCSFYFTTVRAKILETRRAQHLCCTRCCSSYRSYTPEDSGESPLGRIFMDQVASKAEATSCIGQEMEEDQSHLFKRACWEGQQ